MVNKLTPRRVRSLLRDSIGGERSLWILFLLMLATSFFTLTGAANDIYRAGSMAPIFKHIFFLLTSFGTCWIASQLPASFYRREFFWLYSLLCLVLTIWLLVDPVVINGAARWIDIGRIRLQPSELFKLCLILWGALVGSMSYESVRERKLAFNIYWAISMFFIAIYFINNASTAILMTLFLGIYSLVLRMPIRSLMRWFVVISILSLLGLLFIMSMPKETLRSLPGMHRSPVWKERIDGMLVSETKGTEAEYNDSIAQVRERLKYDLEKDDDYQEKLGQVALALGAFDGLGIGRSKTRDFLPMAYSDYALSILVEELGLGIYLWVILLYALWFIFAGRLGQRETNRYRKLVVFGIGLFVPIQVLMNIAVVSGLFVTGQPLPLISWGGTSLLSTGLMMGILIGISRTQQEIRMLETVPVSEESSSDTSMS